MYQIRPWLCVGSFRESIDAEALALHRVDMVLQLAAPAPAPGRETLVLLIEDGEPIPPDALSRGVDFVARAHREGKVCLVACGAGISRSVIVATAALHRVENIPLLDAAIAVQAANPNAVFHPVLWDSLAAFAGADVPLHAVLSRLS